ncbi:MAG: phosphocholine cytidylyltransferase family protein [Coriobacteriia bacterium]|nr:phosphocholine cytidylyltransferase family protein [Coriobacteriia bacterium]
MRIILLAAGVGSRLMPFTSSTPKCLFRLGARQTALGRLLGQSSANGIDDIVVVTGYHRELVEAELPPTVRTVNNPFFRTTNSVASLWFAREFLDRESLIMNSDIVLENALFELMIRPQPADTRVFIDVSRTFDADYRVAVHGKSVVMMGKELTHFAGEYVGVTRVSQEGVLHLRTHIEKMVLDGQTDEWYENALVRLILERDFSLGHEDVSEYRWAEIDTTDDLLAARRIYETDDGTP